MVCAEERCGYVCGTACRICAVDCLSGYADYNQFWCEKTPVTNCETFGYVSKASSTQSCTSKTGYIKDANGMCSTCPSGHYEQDGICKECSAGTYAANKGSTSCTQCPRGQYSNVGMSQCKVCPEGEQVNSTQSGCERKATFRCTQFVCDVGVRELPNGDCECCTGGNNCMLRYHNNKLHKEPLLPGVAPRKSTTPESKIVNISVILS